ncbi:MAG: glycosyltransferase family 4 protein [Actinomycetota bacterium]
MRIAVVAPCWFEVPPPAYGGIEWLCSWLVEGLIKRGHDVTLVAAGQNKTGARFLQTYPTPPSYRLGESMPEVVQAAAALDLLAGVEVDIVHDHTLAGPLLAAGRRVPTVITAHGPVTGELGQYFRYLGRHIHMVAISEAQMKSAPDLPWEGRVYNAIDVDTYPFVEEKDDYIVFLGRMSPEKGADLAIEAATAAGLPIILAGKNIEPFEKEYFRERVAPKLSERVIWVGEADAPKKKALLSKARCMIFPIQWEEPFGIVMAEALACGTPVVALRGGSVPELIEDGVTGFIFDEPASLVKGIRESKSLSAAACRDRAKKLFDVDRMAEGYESVYRRVLERQPT